METRICKRCGRELPVDEFYKDRFGVTLVCKDCLKKSKAAGREKKNELMKLKGEVELARIAHLSEFTPRELMEELARRGYRGKLEFTRVEVIDINNF